jgi:2-octaprenylphenol hydroxylase
MVGQGVNLGLLDAVTLAEVVVNANKKNRDFGSYHTLRRYERFRKSETTFMLAMINSLRQKQLRRIGFQVTNYMPFLKNFFSKYALGVREDLPKLTRVS